VESDDVRALVDRARARDPDAWERLYRRGYPRLFSYARRRLPSDHAADDAVSEAMARALDRIDSFAWRGAGFDAWLYGILRNVLSETRRSGARLTSDTGGAFSAVVVDERSEHQPLERLLRQEQMAEVRAAFARLTADEQELLELRVVGGLTANDVGAVLGKRPGAVRMAQARALDHLRRLIGASCA
jgi:RNA polymerase sigma-70 factor (ECF subfamily)